MVCGRSGSQGGGGEAGTEECWLGDVERGKTSVSMSSSRDKRLILQHCHARAKTKEKINQKMWA